MLLQCNNQGCKKLAEVLLDAVTDEIICGECHKPIKNVTSFIKVNLRANKQFVKKGATSGSFSVKCAGCGRNVGPNLNEKGQPICPECGAEIKLSKAFENVLKQSLRKAGTK